MIFSYQVRWIAERHLREILKPVPGVLKFLLEETKFQKWCELCAVRLNELNRLGAVRSRFAVQDFIKTAVIVYSQVQLKKQGHNVECPIAENDLQSV
jgi:hypothetical protein